MEKGDRLIMRTGGGGGYGDPAERTEADRAMDSEEGYV